MHIVLESYIVRSTVINNKILDFDYAHYQVNNRVRQRYILRVYVVE